MSVFQNLVSGVEDISVKITGNTATDIVDGTDQAWFVPVFSVGENNGSTPNLTVALFDGTNSYALVSAGSLWVAKAVTAKQGLVFNEGYIVPLGWKLRVTSSDASGRFDVVGAKVRRASGLQSAPG